MASSPPTAPARPDASRPPPGSGAAEVGVKPGPACISGPVDSKLHSDPGFASPTGIAILGHDGDAVRGGAVDGGQTFQGEVAVPVDVENGDVRDAAVGIDHRGQAIAVGDVDGSVSH